MKISCFIIDDEPLAIEVLESHISQLDSIEIAGTFQNAIKALEALKETRVDLMFLDIQMPGLTGLDFLKSLKDPPKVILTTAYREYALEGFELDVVDYLLKPISFERFLKAVNKVMDSRIYEHAVTGQSKSEDDFIFLPSGNKKVKVRFSDILYLESKRDYVYIHTRNKEVTTNTTLTEMEETLPSGRFIRIHRSFIVNLENVESWSHTEVDVGEQALPIGRTYKKQAIEFLKNNMGHI